MKKSVKLRLPVLLLSLLSFILSLSLVFSVFVIFKLRNNNLFSKSIMLDNNYFMDYSVYAYDEDETDGSSEYSDKYRGGMIAWEYTTYDANGQENVIRVHIDSEIYYLVEDILSNLREKYPDAAADLAFLDTVRNRLYQIYNTWGLSTDGDKATEEYLAANSVALCVRDPSTDRVLIDVPYVSQEGEFPNGCEAVSATMLLNFYGFDTTPGDFIDGYLKCEPTYIKWGCRYGPNPKLAYAGDPRDEDGGFGCFAPVIAEALNEYLPAGYYAKNTTGLSLNTLKSRYIDNGIPVAVWVTVGMEEVDRMLQWQSVDKSETYLYPANEHCMVLVGYDEDSYIFADPYNSNGIVEYSVEDCVLAYNTLGMQSVIISGGN